MLSNRRAQLVCLLIVLLLTFTSGVTAQPMACPHRLAFIENDPALVRQAELMKAIYARIGCPDVAFVALPGRRGVVAFNMGEVQGEMMRLPGIEMEYTRPFLRVSQPVVQMTGRLWAREASMADAGPLGFVLGVVWQERYAQAHKGSIGYHGQADLFRAYATGVIDRFVAEDPAVAAALRESRIQTVPAHRGALLVSTPLYHYLSPEYAAAAAAVAGELTRQPPLDGGAATQ